MKDSMVNEGDFIKVAKEVGAQGGVFKTTSGLIERFSHSRVTEIPLTESSVVGFGVGIGVEPYGKKPIVAYFRYNCLRSEYL
ncbi:unnamed protein product [Acidithrix sp. C25]|nr:hypothetical protein [Acidithrix sp. C25]CAG4910137.1 unnamed protein product [Acidithrix sp. C25]